MKSLGPSRYALCSYVAAALLAGCGGSRPLIGVPGAMLQARALQSQSAQRDDRGSWMLLEARGSPAYKATQPLLYVTNASNNNVTVYHAHAKDPAPIATISDGLNFPTGDCIDSQGTLYVTNEPVSNGGYISEYLLGQTKASAFIKDGISTPAFCAIDAKGNLWVANIGLSNVTEYLHGSKKPHKVITNGLDYPVGLAIDHFGNLYVANRPVSGSPNVVVYAPGSKTPTRTITEGVTYPVGIGVDSKSVLYVTNTTANNVKEYRPGRDHPYRTITTAMDFPVAVVLNAAGWLYVANIGDNMVVEFRPGSVTLSRREVTKDINNPNSVAYFPPLIP